jgi:restriction endonuclease
MKLQFRHQKFQVDAANAVCDVFMGQPYQSSRKYIVDPGKVAQGSLFDGIVEGFGNAPIQLSPDSVLENIRRIQRSQQIKPSDKLEGKYNITVEMETGTGKTYTYIKTMYELNKRYGWSKFIIVVPSVAIREGVYKSFQITAEHFTEEYGKKIRCFIYVYDSDNERKFAERLDSESAVAVYVKLPGGFYINTPVGKYNPDWAIAFNEGDVKHIYFVAETKGSMSSMQLREIEKAKIHCAREHFAAISGRDVIYDVIDGYESLMAIVR